MAKYATGILNIVSSELEELRNWQRKVTISSYWKRIKTTSHRTSTGSKSGLGRSFQSYQSHPSHFSGSRFSGCWLLSTRTARMQMQTRCTSLAPSENTLILFVTVKYSVFLTSSPVSSFTSLAAHSSKLSPKPENKKDLLIFVAELQEYHVKKFLLQ